MENQKIFEKLREKIEELYFNRINPHDEVYKLTEFDYKLISTEVGNFLDAMLVDIDQRNSWGTDVKFSTIKQIFTNKYHVPKALDERRYKTLSKLSMFLGFKDWMHFKKSCMVIQAEDSDNTNYQLYDTVVKAKELELGYYQGIVTTKSMLEYFLDDAGCTLESINMKIYKMRMQSGYRINDNERCWYNLINFNVREIKNQTALVEIEEFWSLKWYGKNTEPYTENIKERYLYILEYVEGRWKVGERSIAPSIYFEKKVLIEIKNSNQGNTQP